MSNRHSQKTAKSKDTTVSILVTKQIFPGLRRDSHRNEVVRFSRLSEVQAITQKYLADLSALWSRLNNKSSSISRNPTAPVLTPDLAQPSVINHPKISFTLPNAKVGETYTGKLNIQGETSNRQVVIRFVHFDQDIGLEVDTSDFQQVRGTPSKDGELKLSIGFQFKDANAASPIITAETMLFVNPDPKSLWKVLPSDKSDPYFKPDEDIGSLATIGGMSMVSASRRGRSHEHTGAFRDDDFNLANIDGWDIIAVADGAGSAKSSRRGAQIAVKISVDSLQMSLSEGNGDRIIEEARIWQADTSISQHPIKVALYHSLGQAAFLSVKAIEEEAAAKGSPSKDYSTTLLIALHKKTEFGHILACYWVGDGAAAVYRKNKDVILLGEVDSGEYAGQTRFLDKQVMTPEQVMQRLTFTIVDSFTGLILMTDGVSDPKFETDNNLTKIQKWDDLWSEIAPLLTNIDEAPTKLLKWLEFWSPGNHDDRTIAMLY